ncbi:TEDC1 protein, partial [Eudromia elegans]|nr:TEDC1 protein [Eudromia elegans]
DAQVRCVKSALWYYGYGRPELYGLPCDGSAGSRELLLAFSWLLHTLHLPEQLLARDRVRTGDETSVCTCEDDLPCSREGRTEMVPEYSLEDQVDVRYLQWLSGRLRFQWQSLHALHQEQCKLLHKIHLFTSGCHMDKMLGHFSVTETDLVRRPENYKQLLELLESETVQLEAFLEWKQLEQIYWQWMEAVLDDMSEEGSLHEPQDARPKESPLPKAGSCPHWAGSLLGKIDRLSTDLTTVRDQLRELVTHRRSLWSEKVKTREEELEKENFCAAATKIQEAVELKLLDVTHRCAATEKRVHGSCRLVFRSKDSAGKAALSSNVSAEPVPTISATEVIRELQVRKASLERELKRLQEECRQRMDGIAQGLHGVICISP